MTLSFVNGLPPLLSVLCIYDQESRHSGTTSNVCVTSRGIVALRCYALMDDQSRKRIWREISVHTIAQSANTLTRHSVVEHSSTNGTIAFCKLHRYTAQIYIFKMLRWYVLEIDKRPNCVMRYILRAVEKNEYGLCAISAKNSARV